MSVFSRLIGVILVGLIYGFCIEDIVHGQLLYTDTTTNVLVTLSISLAFGAIAFFFTPKEVKELL